MAMRHSAAALVVALLFAPGGVAAQDWFEALVRGAAPGGDLDAHGTLTRWTGDGPVTEPIDGRIFLARAKAGLMVAPPMHAPVAGVGDEALAAALGVPGCVTLEYFVFYFGPPGGAIVGASNLGPSPFPLCGEPAELFSAAIDPSGVSLVLSCGRATVWVAAAPGSTQCGLAGTSISGSGVLYSLSFFGLSFDHFRGNEAMLTSSGAV